MFRVGYDRVNLYQCAIRPRLAQTRRHRLSHRLHSRGRPSKYSPRVLIRSRPFLHILWLLTLTCAVKLDAPAFDKASLNFRQTFLSRMTRYGQAEGTYKTNTDFYLQREGSFASLG